MNLLIPRLYQVKLSGFNPIFNSIVEFSINNGLFIILGGNGLGKTTLLQSIVFGIAGPAGENVEPQHKDRRWNKNYFRDRLDNVNNAVIEVWFKMGSDDIKLKRGIGSDRITDFYLNENSVSSDKQSAETKFDNYLKENCGYNSIEDFYFVVHKLCYLSEKRENLAWDLDSQTRIIMQILSDENIENQFRKRRIQIKELDSSIRHKNVDINALDRRIKAKAVISGNPLIKDNDIVIPIQKTTNEEFGQSQLNDIQKELLEVNKAINNKQREFYDLRFQHANVVAEVELLRESLSKFEHAFFFEQLNKFESKEAKLAMYKLIHHKLCPSCGNKSEKLYQQALEYIKEECCPLCGTEHILGSETLSPGTEAELGEKLKIKIELEKSLITIEKQIEVDNKKLSDLNLLINQHILSRKSTVIFIDRSQNNVIADKETVESLETAYQNLIFEKNELQIQFNKMRGELEEEYSKFNSVNNKRIETMFEFYEKYATEFLSIPCSLTPVENADKFVNLKLFVPFFNNKIRRNPDSCSEAQRFFLDIAFRMALIDLINSLSNYSGSFICETPESALDITYINNVAEMFDMFTKNKNTLLLTSNVQYGGIAQNLLKKIKPQKAKMNSFLNLIEIGNLSKVQSSEEGQRLLNAEINKILKGSL